jgi:hypothetical protein
MPRPKSPSGSLSGALIAANPRQTVGGTMRSCAVLLAFVVAISTGCHPGPVINSGARSVGGTIAGIVATTDSTVAVPGRKVTITEINTKATYDSTTAVNGGYTIKVPEGTYSIEVELRPGETLAKRPEQTRITNGDLDSGRDFVITIK